MVAARARSERGFSLGPSDAFDSSERSRAHTLRLMRLVRVLVVIAAAWCVQACSAHRTAAYRVGSNASTIAADVCEALTGRREQASPESGTLRCYTLHEFYVDLQFSGDVLRVRSATEQERLEIALILGRLAATRNITITLEELR